MFHGCSAGDTLAAGGEDDEETIAQTRESSIFVNH